MNVDIEIVSYDVLVVKESNAKSLIALQYTRFVSSLLPVDIEILLELV
jgi:hypothetical protein